ncbi:MAG: 4-hydroxy-tetrahydrodipicolinate synthase [Bacteroidia bacterium]|nr:4-hydroxy-tetrahydrodipicolinate synthase [Bacteroidia bacterium]
MEAFSGTGVAVITPFQADFSLDEAALRRVLQHVMAGQCEYLVALGTTGEPATLTPAEQARVLEIFFEEAGDIPVVIGIGGNDTAAVVAAAKARAADFPAAGILSVTPYYNKPSQEGLVRHYQAVAAATDLPLILYNVPGRTACNMLPDTVLRIARDCETVVAVKEASGNMEQAMDIIAGAPPGFTLLSGDDALTLPLISVGARGVISVVANAFPASFSQMVRLALRQEVVHAAAIHYNLLKFTQLIFAEGNPVGVKAAMADMQLCEPWVRLPLVPASPALVARLSQALSHIGVKA